MCGIAGFSLSESERVNARRLTKLLLLGIEHRGKDATGFAFLDSTGSLQVHKSDMKATDFIRSRNCMPKRQRTAIMHVRAWTQGPPSRNENNHPIVSGSLVGVHNGVMMNDNDVWQAIGWDKKNAEVDSEAIFAALAYVDEPTTDVLEALYGSIAIAWMDTGEEQNRLHLSRVDSSPLIVCETVNGSQIFASEAGAIEMAAELCGLELKATRTMDEGQYWTVLDGEIQDVHTFKPNFRPTSYGGYGSYNSWEYDAEHGIYFREPKGQTRKYNRRASYPTRTAVTTAPTPRRHLTLATHPDAGCQRVGTGNEQREYRLLNESAFDAPSENVRLNDADWADRYHSREEAISEHIKLLTTATEDSEVRANVVREAFDKYHGSLRPGDWVETFIAGEVYAAELLTLPKTFPEGAYVLRACVPTLATVRANAQYTTEAEYEWLLVRRNAEEFWAPATAENVVDDIIGALA